MNALFVGLMSALYSFLFIITSDHIEFLRQLSKSKTLHSGFWNWWSDFIRAGNMKYLGYAIVGLTLLIFLSMVIKRTINYDEYQFSILSRSLAVAGVVAIMAMPVIMVMLLSDPNYTVETILMLAVIQWFSVLIADLVYIIRY